MCRLAPFTAQGCWCLSVPLSVTVSSCQTCREEPLLPVDNMEVRELGEQFHLRPFHLCQDLSAHCMHFIMCVETVVDAYEDLLAVQRGMDQSRTYHWAWGVGHRRPAQGLP